MDCQSAQVAQRHKLAARYSTCGSPVTSLALAGAAVNDKLALSRVLMLGTREETVIGRPFVPHARVTAAVEVRLCASVAGAA